MKKKIIYAFMLFVFASVPMVAKDCYDSNSCCENCSAFYVDYLFWKVCETDLNYSPENETFYVNPDRDSGWRIGGLYQCGPTSFGARYTSFHSKTTRNFASDEIASFKFDWDVVDLEIGYTLSFNCHRYIIKPFAGAKLAWINETYLNTDNDDEEDRQKFDGYGLYVGSEGRFYFPKWKCFSNCLETSLLLRGSLGILESTSKTKSADSPSRADECVFITTVEVFAGLDFSYYIGDCFRPHFLIGYEANTVIGWREMDSSNDRATLGLGGLVARFRVDF